MVVPPQIEVSTLGMADSLILMVLALVVFGPRRLPQIGRQLGKLMYEFRKASNDFKFQMEEELRNAEEADRRKREEEERKRLTLEAPSESVSATTAAAEMHEADSAAFATGEPKMESARNGLKIQPPSTGEIVAAERPGSRFAAEAEEKVEAGEEPASEIPPDTAAVREEHAQLEEIDEKAEAPMQTGGESAPPATEAVSRNG